MTLLLLLLACQEPFGRDRHQLEGFRVAGVGVLPQADGSLRGRALLIDQGRPWTDARADLAWAWLDPEDDPAEWGGPGDAVGPDPRLELPEGGGQLLLVAVSPEGEERRAVIELDAVPEQAAVVGPLEARALPWRLGSLEDEDLALAAREDTAPTDAEVAPTDGFLRLTEQDPGVGALRWMSTGGTWLELDPLTADWTPGSLILDDGEIEETRAGEPGVVTILALRPTEEAGGGWRALDLFVGDPPLEAGARVDGHWLPGALVGPQEATLVLDDTAPLGLRAESPSAVPGPLPAPDHGSCAEAAVFRAELLHTQRCTRKELVGRQLLLEGKPGPAGGTR